MNIHVKASFLVRANNKTYQLMECTKKHFTGITNIIWASANIYRVFSMFILYFALPRAAIPRAGLPHAALLRAAHPRAARPRAVRPSAVRPSAVLLRACTSLCCTSPCCTSPCCKYPVLHVPVIHSRVEIAREQGCSLRDTYKKTESSVLLFYTGQC